MTQEDQSFPLDRSSGWKMTHQAGSDRIASPETSGSLLVRCISPYPHPACAPASMASATATAWSRARLLTATGLLRAGMQRTQDWLWHTGNRLNKHNLRTQ
jgi:hypothetical protein